MSSSFALCTRKKRKVGAYGHPSRHSATNRLVGGRGANRPHYSRCGIISGIARSRCSAVNRRDCAALSTLGAPPHPHREPVDRLTTVVVVVATRWRSSVSYQTLLLSVLLYTWTLLLSADVRTPDAFHQKCLRQLFGIRWYDRVRNDEVLQQIGPTSLSRLLSRRHISVFGHVA